MSDWKQLRDFIKVESGFAFPSDAFSDFGVPIIRMSDLQKGIVTLNKAARVDPKKVIGLDRFKLQNGDFLIGMSGSLGAYGVVDSELESSYLNQRVGRIVKKDQSSGIYQYLILLLTSSHYLRYANKIATGIAQLNISARQIEDFYSFIPSINEQQVIANILNTLDTQIRQTEALIAKLQHVKQGLLYDLLTRGIDESGQLRPPYEQAPELYKASPLGWIPKEWESTELGNVLSHIDAGRSPNCPDIPAPSGVWGVLKVSAVHPDGFKEQETKIVEQSVFHNPQLEVKDGDLLITRANTPELVGLPCLVYTDRSRLMLSDKTLRLNFKEAQDKAFFFYTLTQSWVRSQIQVAATGTSMSMKNISQSALKSLKVKEPPATEQKMISLRVYEAARQISKESQFLNKLKKQKAGLMDDLLTGRVRVTELIDQQQQAS
ncbi:type I restriction enzyme S subunit [Vreelandella songnenensis]|uniref:Type I restriction enzyme S subunit n=1 Tax=Vreelandella songnenensis TaxID=1176243 RepID=A0A2T0V3Q5_9GAMM|nr:restriction endonuclease subunit S [Halomonas songnenensis]PRY64803.1 type I restriction enzyme S subunit [Halomonas songnenensis]